MNWKPNDTGLVCEPYVVKFRQGRWVAQRHAGRGFPEHLGSFKTRAEAQAACEKARAAA